MPLKIWNVIWNQSSDKFEVSFNLQTDFDHLEKKKIYFENMRGLQLIGRKLVSDFLSIILT